MPVKEATPVSLSSVLLGGKATVTLPPRPYRRAMRTIDVVNPAGGAVTIYRGLVGSMTRVAGFPQGADNQYATPFNVPSGQAVVVQWDVAPADLTTARATFTWMEETLL